MATATILSGASLSNAVNIDENFDYKIGIAAALEIPAAWTTANITFQVSRTGAASDYHNLRDRYGVEITATVSAAGDAIDLDIDIFSKWRFFKIRSGTSATPVNQAADRAIIIATSRL